MNFETAKKYLKWLKEIEELSDAEILAIDIGIACIKKVEKYELKDEEVEDLYDLAAKGNRWNT